MESRLPCKVYNLMISHSEDSNEWALEVKNVLVECTFENIWKDEYLDDENAFLRKLRERLINRFYMDWEMRLGSSD